jgi:hypothetical protein
MWKNEGTQVRKVTVIFLKGIKSDVEAVKKMKEEGWLLSCCIPTVSHDVKYNTKPSSCEDE